MVRKFQDDGDLPLDAVCFHELDGLLNQREQVGWLEFILFAALFDAGEVEHIFNERRKAAAFLAYESEVFPLFRSFGDLSALQALSHEPDGSNRRAQFVRNTGNKIAFHVCQLVLAIERAPGRKKPDERCDRGNSYKRPKPERAVALMFEEGGRTRQINTDSQQVVSI